MADQQERHRRAFSETAQREAAATAARLAETLAGRPAIKGITIDGPASRDLDDALWLERDAHGGYRLDISIADVGALVTPELTPALDQAAFQRSFTRYFAQGNAPMLPRPLSEDRLSLLEGQPRPTITLSIPFDARLHMGEPAIQRTALVSCKRFTYQEADEEIRHPRTDFAPMLQDAFRLAQRLLHLRSRRGALALYDLATGWATTEEGVLFQLPASERHQSHLLIQEWMIVANQALAHYLAARGIVALYRNHAARAIAPERAALRELLDTAAEHPEQVDPERVRATVTLALERARYAPTVLGHFGLNLPAYLHATSPLRRYPDLVNQRILAAVLQERPLPYTSRELESIAAQVNAAEDAVKEARQSHFLGTYDEQLRTMIAGGAPGQDSSAGSLSALDARLFHSVLRMAAEAHMLRSEVEQELLRRLDEELLGAHDLFTILFRFQQSGEAWERVKRAVLEWLQSHPYHAISLLVMGQQALGWDEPVWETATLSPGYQSSFQARARIKIAGRQYASSLHTATQKAQARQAAGAELLARIAGVEIAPEAPESPQAPQPEMTPTAVDTRAVSTLQEMAQRNAIRNVTYSYEQAGPPHAPTFTCTCVVTTLDGRTIERQAASSTKKGAAQAAAFEVLSAIRLFSGHF